MPSAPSSGCEATSRMRGFPHPGDVGGEGGARRVVTDGPVMKKRRVAGRIAWGRVEQAGTARRPLQWTAMSPSHPVRSGQRLGFGQCESIRTRQRNPHACARGCRRPRVHRANVAEAASHRNGTTVLQGTGSHRASDSKAACATAPSLRMWGAEGDRRDGRTGKRAADEFLLSSGGCPHGRGSRLNLPSKSKHPRCRRGWEKPKKSPVPLVGGSR